MTEKIKASYAESLRTLQAFVSDENNIKKTAEVSELIAGAFKGGNKVIIAGNGGSACDAMHFAEEFTGKFRSDRKSLPVIALTDPAHITAVGNDFGFEYVFSRGIEAHGKKGDVFIGITTSGNSPDIIKAIEKSKENGLTPVALLGKGGGKVKGMCPYEFIVAGATSDRVQEVHMVVLHIVIEGAERILFPENYQA